MTIQIVHGTRSSYTNYKCRCEDCTNANAEYKTRKVRVNIHVRASSAIEDLLKGKEPEGFTHGTAVAYEWHGCRCRECREAAKEAWKQARLIRSLRQ